MTNNDATNELNNAMIELNNAIDERNMRDEIDAQMREYDELNARSRDTMTITHSLTKKQRARLRAYFATHNVETTKNARYNTRTISRDAYEYAMRVA